MDLTLSPFDVKGLHFKNRIFHTPTTFNFSDPRGYVSDQCVAAYESIARGGHAAVTVGATCVRWDGLINERMLGIYDDTYVIGFRPLVEAIHNNDALAGIQLFYGGLIPGLMSTTPLPPGVGWIPETISWGPSDKMTIGNPQPGIVPTEVYEELVECYAQGARRAKEAGFDYVSFHFCHGSLPHTNLSLLSNVGRTDKYADHFLFCEEIIQRTQELCGKDFPLIPRLCCDENLEGGYDLEYFVEHFAPRLHKLGIAALDCTFGSMLKAKSRRPDIRSDEFIGSSFYSPRLVNLDNIKTIKRLMRAKGIDMPVVGSCKLCTADDVRAMVEGGAEFAGVCHLSMDDPEFPHKMMQGRDNEICRPTHSGVLMSGNIFGKGLAQSMENPEFGREREYKIIPTNRPKKVVIVGGGSGGMEYARVATLIGHKVVLFEKAPRLGGTMDWAGNYPHIPQTEVIRWEPEYRSLQVKKLGVDCRLGVTATSEMILAEKPDVLVIATGARARLPAIDGLEAGRKRGFVLTMDQVMARENAADPGASPLIWGAGEGFELALELVRQGRKVRLIDPNPYFVPAVYLGYRSMSVLPWLAQAGVTLETDIAVTKVGDKSVSVSSGSDAKLNEISCDSLIVCLGRESNTELKEQMAGKVPVIHVVGDARAPRSYTNALYEAAYLARQI